MLDRARNLRLLSQARRREICWIVGLICDRADPFASLGFFSGRAFETLKTGLT